MSTVKLYDEDSYISEFEGKVLSCERAENGFAVILDKTAFFPEAGGQPADRGVLGGAEMLDVKIASDGTVTHFVSYPLEIGSTVRGVLDFERRFNFMQNHTGEHIVSGIVHRLFGLDNVGFHLSEELVTLDFNAELCDNDLRNIELLANKAVWSNAGIKTYYPSEDELKSLEYRSKKELDGDIRIVEIEGVDMCACCAPHVKTTSEVGLIKLLDTEKMRGGTRIIMKCGRYALDDYNCKYRNVKEISALLSSKQEDTAAAVKKLDSQLSEEKMRVRELKKRLIGCITECSACENRFLFENGLDIKELQLLADSLHKKHGGIRGVFSPAENGYSFAICGCDDELLPFFSEFKQVFTVRGGGRNGMVQGTVLSDEENIKNYFENR